MSDESQTLCLCSGEYLESAKAFRLGCDQAGGCQELRQAMAWSEDDDDE